MLSHIDISPRERYRFWESQVSRVEVAEFMFLQDIIQSDVDFSDGEGVFPPLALAMREYGRDPSQWEKFLRLLLHKRVDLHSPVAHPRETAAGIDYFSGYGTPLNELFHWTETAYDGETAAVGWLQILSSEGYDVMGYLEKEAALHAEHMQFIYPDYGMYLAHISSKCHSEKVIETLAQYFSVSKPYCLFPHLLRYSRSFSERSLTLNLLSESPRRLIFHWGSSPSISWEPWIEPNSSTYLVREEFKHTVILPPSYGELCFDPETTWPLTYPAWAYGLEWQPRDRARERANRRLKKKSMKAARAQGLKKRERMPGAWPV